MSCLVTQGTAFLCYLIAKHPEVERKLKDEIEEVIGDKQPTFEQISNELNYLDLVVKECMRIYPPASQLADRRAQKDDKIGGVHVPKNIAVEIFPYVLHHSKLYWNEPEKFNPDRFLQGGK